MLRGVGWLLVADVLGWDCLTVEDQNNGMSRNVGNQLATYDT